MNDKNFVTFGKLWHRYFAEGSTIHGMHYVCMAKCFFFRRLIWSAAFIACFIGFCINTTQRVQFFLSDPINVNIEINHKDEMIFPAVTICNHNMFRITKASEFHIYKSVQDVLNLTKGLNHSSRLLRNSSVSYYDELSHARNDMIFNCYFGGQLCNESDFDMTRTDFGICYTFRAHNAASVKHSGSTYGLIVTINVEQYEYMGGPATTAGVKVLLHERNEVPRVGDLGFNVPPGFQALVGVQYRKVENIPSPKSHCHKNGDQKLSLFGAYDYTDIGCRAEREADFLMKQCLCQPIDVPSSADGLRECNPFDHRFCLQPAKDDFRSFIANESHSKCIPTCITTSYIPSISYASIAQTNAEKILIREQKKLDLIKERLLIARENQSRLDAQFFDRDRRLINHFFKQKRLMIEQEFYPDDNLLRNMSAHLQPDCVTDLTVLVRERQRLSVAALHDIKAVLPEFSSHDTGLLLTSYVQFLWDVSLRLGHLEKHEIRDLIGDIKSKSLSNEAFVRESRFIRRELSEVKETMKSLQQDIAKCTEALGKKLHQHRFLLANRQIDSFFGSLKNFSDAQMLCLGELEATMERSFERIVEALQNFTSGAQNDSVKLLHHEFDTVRAMCDRCQRGFIDHSSIDRISVERFVADAVAKTESDLQRVFDKLERRLSGATTLSFGAELGFNTLSIIEAAIGDYQKKAITKYELALNLTSDGFSNHLAFLTALLSNIRTFIQGRERMMGEYLAGVQGLDEQMPKMLLEFAESGGVNANRSYRRLGEKTVAMSGVRACTTVVRNLSAKRVATQAALEQDMVRAIRELIEELKRFYETTKLDNRFVMKNFLQLSVFYRELREELITQQRAYNVWALLCDVGGGLGLFIGASFISCFELVDTFMIGFASLFQRENPRERRASAHDLDTFDERLSRTTVKSRNGLPQTMSGREISTTNT